MKQESLKKIRNYRENPRAAHEPNDTNHRGGISFEGQVSLAKQSEAESCDINLIMKKYEATGWLPDNDGRTPTYGDFSTLETFQEALSIVSSAQSAFHALPAEIRAKFSNDPARLVEYVERAQSDGEIAADLVKMGLAEERPEEPGKLLKEIRDFTRPKAPKSKQEPDSSALSD